MGRTLGRALEDLPNVRSLLPGGRLSSVEVPTRTNQTIVSSSQDGQRYVQLDSALALTGEGQNSRYSCRSKFVLGRGTLAENRRWGAQNDKLPEKALKQDNGIPC